MIKDIINYNDKKYQLSTACIKSMTTFETMIFPIEDDIISGNEVYCFRTTDAGESKCKHIDIYEHPEKYLTEKNINEYLKSKKNDEYIVIVDGEAINSLYEAYLWLRKAWCDEPYNMWYETFGKKDSEWYRECIFIEPVRGYGDNDYAICSLEEFEEFIHTH